MKDIEGNKKLFIIWAGSPPAPTAFALWTPGGIVWWRARGGVLVLTTALCAAAWGLLMKASLDAGAEVR